MTNILIASIAHIIAVLFGIIGLFVLKFFIPAGGPVILIGGPVGIATVAYIIFFGLLLTKEEYFINKISEWAQ